MSHAFDIRTRYVKVSQVDVYECEGTTLDYDLVTGGRERPRRGKLRITGVRIA
jgi:hypothetical protein